MLSGLALQALRSTLVHQGQKRRGQQLAINHPLESDHVTPAVPVFAGLVSGGHSAQNTEMEAGATPTPILGGSNGGANTPATAPSAPAPPFPLQPHIVRRLLEAAVLPACHRCVPAAPPLCDRTPQPAPAGDSDPPSSPPPKRG